MHFWIFKSDNTSYEKGAPKGQSLIGSSFQFSTRSIGIHGCAINADSPSLCLASRNVTLGTTLPEAVSQTHHAFSHRFYSADRRDNYALGGTNHRLMRSYELMFTLQNSKTKQVFLCGKLYSPVGEIMVLYRQTASLNALKADNALSWLIQKLWLIFILAWREHFRKK